VNIRYRIVSCQILCRSCLTLVDDAWV